VAALCVPYESDFRPNMTIVVKALQPLLKAAAATAGEPRGHFGVAEPASCSWTRLICLTLLSSLAPSVQFLFSLLTLAIRSKVSFLLNLVVRSLGRGILTIS
jgi:hypothetical protein